MKFFYRTAFVSLILFIILSGCKATERVSENKKKEFNESSGVEIDVSAETIESCAQPITEKNEQSTYIAESNEPNSAPQPHPDCSTDITDCESIEIINSLTEYLCTLENVSVYYMNLQSGVFYSYNEDSVYLTQSTIKAPYCNYILSVCGDTSKKLTLDEGEKILDLDETEFTIDYLIECAIRYSDNTAYKILYKFFGSAGFDSYSESLGAKVSLSGGRFGHCTARDMALYFADIYEKNNKTLLTHLKNCEYRKQIAAELTEYEVAQKYGYGGESFGFHDAAIVYASSPYVLTVFTNLNKSEYEDFTLPFRKIARAIDTANSLSHKSR